MFRAYFAQHHVDQLTPTVSAVAFLASKFPGRSELEYRSHLGAFGITGLTGCVTSHRERYSMVTGFRLQLIGTLSGGQKSRVAFAALSLLRPHVLLLDEVGDSVLQGQLCTDRWYSHPITLIVSKQSAWRPTSAPKTDCPHSPGYRCSHERYRELERRGNYHLARRAVHQYHCQGGKSKTFAQHCAHWPSQLWVCAEGEVYKYKGDVSSYKVRCYSSKYGVTNPDRRA